jgi:hypothetical protein
MNSADTGASKSVTAQPENGADQCASQKGQNRFSVLRLATERTRGISRRSENSEAGEPKDQAGGELRKLTPSLGQQMKIRAGANSAKTEPATNRETHSDLMMSKQTKMNCTMTQCKKRSFIELRQNLYTMKVTALPPSFD